MRLHMFTLCWGQATHKSCPTRPVNRPVNAFTHNQGWSPYPIAEMCVSGKSSGSYAVGEVRHG